MGSKKKELGLTFDELSEKSGIPKRTILGVFRKEVTTPRIDTVQAIERARGGEDLLSASHKIAKKRKAEASRRPLGVLCDLDFYTEVFKVLLGLL